MTPEEERNEYLSLSRDQQYAYSEFKTRARVLQKDIKTWLSETDRENDNAILLKDDVRMSDLILREGVQWYKTVDSNGFNKNARKAISSALNQELRDTVHHLRNLREHWENTQKYFYYKEKPKIPVNSKTKSLRWYLETTKNRSGLLKDLSPDALVFPGYYNTQKPPDALIAGIFAPRLLLEEIEKIEGIIDKYTEEHTYIRGRIKVRF